MCRLPVGCLPASAPVAASGAPAGAKAPGAHRSQQYDDEFLQFQYKVVPCSKSFRHDFATCPFAHAGESSERRHPSAYLPFLCGATQHSTDLKEKCPFGAACKYAHSHFELWLHPGRFRTKLCSLGGNCKRPVCFFAHSEAELRTTPYSKLDTAAAVAAQQLADMGQLLDANVGSGCALLGSSSSSLTSDVKVHATSSLGSPGNSEVGRNGSGSSSPSNSLSCDEAASLAQLSASVGALHGAPAGAALLDVGGMAHLQGSAYLAAAAAAVDASLSGSADLAIPCAPGSMWPLKQQAQQLLPAAMAYGGPYLQAPLQVLDPQLLGLATAGPAGLPAAAGGELWVLPSNAAAAPLWAMPAAAAQQAMLVQQHQQQQLAFNLSAAVAGPSVTGPMAPGLPVPALLGSANLDRWLPLEGSLSAKDSGSFTMPSASLCRPTPVACGIAQQQQQPAAAVTGGQVVQLLNNQAVQQLLGMLEGAH